MLFGNLFKSKQQKMEEEVTRLVASRECRLLTKQNLPELMRVLEHSCSSCSLIPVRLHEGKPGWVEESTRILNSRVNNEARFIEIDFSKGGLLPAHFYFNTESTKTYFTIFPISDSDRHSCVGLYLRREGAVNSEHLFLKGPYCKEHLPTVYKESAQRDGLEARMSERRWSDDLSLPPRPRHEVQDADDEISVPVILPKGPVLWVSSKGIKPFP